jgi:hypothetical protein
MHAQTAPQAGSMLPEFPATPPALMKPLPFGISPKVGERGKIICTFFNDFQTALDDALPFLLLTLR